MKENRPLRPCVGICLFNKKGEVFLGQRKGDEKGYWQLPQGGIDYGEPPIFAAKRELFEETGVKSLQLIHFHEEWLSYELPVDLRDKLWGGKFKGQKQLWFAFRFLGADSEIDITKEPQEFINWKWGDFNTIDKYIIPFKKDLYTNIIRIIKPNINSYNSNQ